MTVLKADKAVVVGQIDRINKKDKEDDRKFKEIKEKIEEREKEDCKKREKLEKRLEALKENLTGKEERSVEEIKKGSSREIRE